MPAEGGERLPCLAGAEWLKRPQTQAVLRAIEAGGYPARAVGGVVRNALLGAPVADVDVATPAPPGEVIRLAEIAGLKAIPTGLKHGTVTIIVDHTPFEVTTLRKDVETFGRHARVVFTQDWAADARRRISPSTLSTAMPTAGCTILKRLSGYSGSAFHWPRSVSGRTISEYCVSSV